MGKREVIIVWQGRREAECWRWDAAKVVCNSLYKMRKKGKKERNCKFKIYDFIFSTRKKGGFNQIKKCVKSRGGGGENKKKD